MFDLYHAEIHKAVRYPIYVVVPAQILLFMLATLFLLFWIFPSPEAGVSERMALGSFLALVAVNVWCALFWMFYSLRLKRVAPPMAPAEAMEFLKSSQDVNLAEYLDFDAARVLEKAIRFARKKNIALSSVVLLHALLQSKRTDFIFRRLLISKEEFSKGVE